MIIEIYQAGMGLFALDKRSPKMEGSETFCPTSRDMWRQWLKKNHRLKKSIWLVFYKKRTNIPTISWSEAVDDALCFGWIDGKAKPIDEQKSMRFFSQRKSTGTWSKLNKERIKRLTAAGLMTPTGLDAVATAKRNGSWTILDSVEELVIPKDLANEFRTKPGSKVFFLSLSKSTRKAILQWVVLAKQNETRLKRIIEIAELASQKLKPKQFR